MKEIRKALQKDLAAVDGIYQKIHTEEEAGRITVGWLRDVYPTLSTAGAALERGDLFVMEEEGLILGAGIINRLQVDVYRGVPWEHDRCDGEVCVLHTLVIDPEKGRRGLGTEFVRFYEKYAAEHGCPELRIDTNARNRQARAMYHKLGYKEIAIVPATFNGIPGVQLVLLEKYLGEG